LLEKAVRHVVAATARN